MLTVSISKLSSMTYVDLTFISEQKRNRLLRGLCYLTHQTFGYPLCLHDLWVDTFLATPSERTDFFAVTYRSLWVRRKEITVEHIQWRKGFNNFMWKRISTLRWQPVFMSSCKLYVKGRFPRQPYVLIKE